MSIDSLKIALARFFGENLQGEPCATKSNSANDNAGLQPGEVGTLDDTQRSEDYAMHHESASMKRDARLLRLLLEYGPIRRRELDELLDTENTPDLVMRLRRNHGFDLPCERGLMIGGDGCPRSVGLYRLSDTDIPRARAVLHFREHRSEFIAANRQAELARRDCQ